MESPEASIKVTAMSDTSGVDDSNLLFEDFLNGLPSYLKGMAMYSILQWKLWIGLLRFVGEVVAHVSDPSDG